MEIYTSDFTGIYYNEDKEIFVITWKPKTGNSIMSDEILKFELLRQVFFMTKYKPHFLIFDFSEFKYTFSFAVFNWMQSEIYRPFSQLFVQKVALVQPLVELDLFAFNQFIEDIQLCFMQVKLMDSVSSASEWIINQTFSK